MTKNRIIAIGAVVILLVAIFAIAKKQSTRKLVKTTAQIQEEVGVPVQTAAVQIGTIQDTIPVTGNLAALDSVALSSKIPGKVAYVVVREGDPVSGGQIVIQLDQTDARASVRQAEGALAAAKAGIESARARLSQARTSKSVTEVQSSAEIQQAKAGLAAAEANYEKIKKGARSQERMIAENAVATAKANVDNAQANLRRQKQLFDQGAIAAAQLDLAQTQYDVAKAQHDSAKENLSLVEEGARSEDVRAAQTQVTQAKEALRTAQANAGQVALRQEDINSANAAILGAQAMVSQAQAQLALANEQLANTSIHSPISGYVSQRMTEPGQTVVPGVSLMEAVNVQTVYFQADLSETVLAKVKPGQPVGVTVDAYPDSAFTGSVRRIYPTASTSTRNFSVRIHIPNPGSEMRPGMFARGSIVTGNNKGAVLVPQDAVEERAGRKIVFTLEGNTVKMHTINPGLSNPEFIQVQHPTDLGAGDIVITSGHEYLEDGKKVYVRD